MLWLDTSNKSIREKVQRAAEYHEKKYQVSPTVCYIHPSMFADKEKYFTVGKVSVKRDREILPHHFWLGVESKKGKK